MCTLVPRHSFMDALCMAAGMAQGSGVIPLVVQVWCLVLCRLAEREPTGPLPFG